MCGIVAHGDANVTPASAARFVDYLGLDWQVHAAGPVSVAEDAETGQYHPSPASLEPRTRPGALGIRRWLKRSLARLVQSASRVVVLEEARQSPKRARCSLVLAAVTHPEVADSAGFPAMLTVSCLDRTGNGSAPPRQAAATSRAAPRFALQQLVSGRAGWSHRKVGQETRQLRRSVAVQTAALEPMPSFCALPASSSACESPGCRCGDFLPPASAGSPSALMHGSAAGP